MIEITVVRLSGTRKDLPKTNVEKILIDLNTGKETRVQRAARIAETQNGRKLRTRQVQSKRRKLTEKALRMAEKGA